ncbi:mitochondrial 54S ribosomal protein bL27m [Aspergillus clavatus NRRL 1]|uniref:Large ribosomal subunit protein bL27m n=1 Tax=Aspergillus clavatus (strain ATCC 1007 / CBS 513.65 / DSM 816 / NCTC 3887 / NRRL 1 / QM 1276 / 107) TaxID=344612 RepID=A1C4T5_ASPCL|nr:50S ribosomal protein L27, putative [Aspergillus clavatus NRRL 1]EAW14703.1 50S ribosomal protein L27, putative [Aspergillus clavatus NRRL 1]
MLQPRLIAPFRALERTLVSSLRSSPAISHAPRTSLLFQRAPISAPSPISKYLLPFSQVRHASHATQGTANRHSRDPAGKRLGAKKTGGEYVVPGCIIFRQRGTKWFPGENCAMGRDHTIYAAEAGYVRYYLDPERHPDRKYIGVCFEKEGKLPTPRNAPTRRKLNRIAVPRIPDGFETAAQSDLAATVEDGTTVSGVEAANAATGSQLRPGYMYREANWQIGRAAEKAGITAKPYKRDNRWLAWRKRQARAERAAQMKSLKGKKKAAKKSKGGR